MPHRRDPKLRYSLSRVCSRADARRFRIVGGEPTEGTLSLREKQIDRGGEVRGGVRCACDFSPELHGDCAHCIASRDVTDRVADHGRTPEIDLRYSILGCDEEAGLGLSAATLTGKVRTGPNTIKMGALGGEKLSQAAVYSIQRLHGKRAKGHTLLISDNTHPDAGAVEAGNRLSSTRKQPHARRIRHVLVRRRPFTDRAVSVQEDPRRSHPTIVEPRACRAASARLNLRWSSRARL